MSIVIKAGKLISTSDLKLAEKLQKTIKLEEITGGRMPERLVQTGGVISFMLRGEYYELEATQC